MMGVAKAAFLRSGCRPALLLTALLILPLASTAQTSEAGKLLQDEIPFQKWLAEGEREEIPWELTISRPTLSAHQRLEVQITARLDREAAAVGGQIHEYIYWVRVASSEGNWLPNDGFVAGRIDQPLQDRTLLELRLQALFRPGDYQVAVLLYDRVSRLRSLAYRPLRVESLGDDPLPRAWERLPLVEFPASEEGLDAIFQPGVTPLFLPIRNERPLHIELIVGFGTSEQFAGSTRAFRSNLRSMLAALKVLSQLEPANGTIRVTGLDLMHRRVLFELDPLEKLDWPAIRESLSDRSPVVIDADVLAGRTKNAAFFRQVLADRLSLSPPEVSQFAAGSTPGTRQDSSRGRQPLKVVIVVRSPMLFVRGADLDELAIGESCGCRVFDLQSRIGRNNLWDDLGRVMKPLRPKRFVVEQPIDFRKAIGEIIRELSSL